MGSLRPDGSDAAPGRPGFLDRRLEYFVAVCRAGSISRAAVELGMSQPALSQAMRSLEDDMGLELLRRTRHGAEPTEAGAAVLDAAEAASRGIRLAVESAAKPGGSLVVGCNLHASGIVCAAAGPAFKRSHPEVALSVRDLPGNDTLAEGIAAGCEVVESFYSQARSYPPGVSYRRMTDAETVMCVPPDDPLAALDRPLEMGDLAGKTLCIYRHGITDAEDAILDDIERSGADVSLVLCDDGEYSHMDYLVNGWVAPSLAAVADRRRPAVALHMARPAYMEIGLFTVGEPSPAARAFVDEAAALFEERGRSGGAGVAAG